MTRGGFIGFIVDIIAAEEAGDATYRALFDEVPGMCDGRVLCVIIANDCFASAVGSRAAMAALSSSEVDIGFSHHTCLPAARAAIDISAWVSLGVQTEMSSTAGLFTTSIQSEA